MLCIAYRKEENGDSFISFLKMNVFKLNAFLHISVPALCFAVQKNLIFIAVSNLDAATFQVASQGKILSTAMFSYLILGTQLSRRQISSLFLLLLGVCLVQFEISQRGSSESSNPNDDPFIGFFAIVGVCISSGFATVYFE
jgi:UDP-sugar transporter A1/2/3